MYAPSSYNDTVTGETLSSVSEKSETYSNEGSHNDYTVSGNLINEHKILLLEFPTCLDTFLILFYFKGG